MKLVSILVAGAIPFVALLAADIAAARPAPRGIRMAALSTDPPPDLTIPVEKVNAYIGCINRLSGRAFQARERYFSWVGKTGPTGRERIV